jgi:hypothetical protein
MPLQKLSPVPKYAAPDIELARSLPEPARTLALMGHIVRRHVSAAKWHQIATEMCAEDGKVLAPR